MRRLAYALGGGAFWALFAITEAWAARGTDVFGNVSPDSQVQGLAAEHPLSWYALDRHVDGFSLDLGGVGGDPAAAVLHAMCGWIWFGVSLVVRTVIDLFMWAFSLDLINGPTGALRPVADAIGGFYDRMGGDVWLAFAVVCLGIWATYVMLGRRETQRGLTSIGLSILAVIVAMFFIAQPERVIGWASQQTNAMSVAFLSAVNMGGSGDPKQRVTTHLFDTLIYKPWMVLQFGGLRHCVDTGRMDEDNFPTPVAPHDPTRDICRDHKRYAEAYLSYAPGSEARNDVYEDINKGEGSYDKADSPAVDMQQAGGADQRFGMLMVIVLGVAGAVLLLGYLALAIILAQVFALVLVAFAPVALIVGVFPGKGHELFKSWLSKLGIALVIKAFWSLVLAVLLFVNVALVSATASMGWLVVFLLSAAYWWGAFFFRKRALTSMVQKSEVRRIEHKTSESVHKATQAVAAPVSTLASMATNRDRQRQAEPSYSGQRVSEATQAQSQAQSDRGGRSGRGEPSTAAEPSRVSVPSASSPRPAPSVHVSQEQPMRSEKPVRVESFNEQTLERARAEKNGKPPERPVPRGVPTPKPGPTTFEEQLEKDRKPERVKS